jgi:hypothetical protein
MLVTGWFLMVRVTSVRAKWGTGAFRAKWGTGAFRFAPRKFGGLPGGYSVSM